MRNLPSFLKANILWFDSVLLLLPHLPYRADADLHAGVQPLDHATVFCLTAVVPSGAGDRLPGGTVGMA